MSDNSEKFDFPQSIDTVDKIPAQYRGLYHQNPADNSLELLPEVAEKFVAPGLKRALENERGRSRGLEKEASAAKARLAAIAAATGVDDIEALPAAIQDLKSKTAPNAVDAVRTEIARSFETQIEAQKREAAKLRKILHVTLVDNAATSAIAAAKGNVRTLLPHVRAQMALVEEGGELVARVVDSFGNPRYRESDGLPMGVSDLVGEMRRDTDFSANFEASGNSGSGAKGAGGSGSPGGRAVQSYTQAAWRERVARAKPDERQQLLKDAAAGRIKIT